VRAVGNGRRSQRGPCDARPRDGLHREARSSSTSKELGQATLELQQFRRLPWNIERLSAGQALQNPQSATCFKRSDSSEIAMWTNIPGASEQTVTTRVSHAQTLETEGG
jgi:hypothetical protein